MAALDPQRLECLRKAYRLKRDAADEFIVAAMLEAYEAVSGNLPSDLGRRLTNGSRIYGTSDVQHQRQDLSKM